MIRAGAIAKQVIKELESMGIDVKNGATGQVAEDAKQAFVGRSLSDYYTEGEPYASWHIIEKKLFLRTVLRDVVLA